MDIRGSIAFLKHLNAQWTGPRQITTSSRLATQWIRSSLESNLDMLMRLSVLEGAAGATPGEWVGKRGDRPRNGLKKALAWFDDKGYSPDPNWFSPKETGLFRIVSNCVASKIKSLGLRTVDPLDIISEGLMGLGANLGDVTSTSYAVGRNLGERIRTGKENPRDVAKSKLCRYFKNRVDRTERKQRDVLIPVDEQGQQMQIRDEIPEETLQELTQQQAGTFLLLATFPKAFSKLKKWAPKTPDGRPIKFKDNVLGRKIRDLMRASWHSSQPMLLWLDVVENQGRFPTQKEVAERAGMTPSAFRARHWKPRWIKFLKDFRSKTSLLKDLQQEAASHRIEWNPADVLNTTPEHLFPSRVASLDGHKPGVRMGSLTKKGARSVTQTLDRVANLMQKEFETLGVPEKVATDFAYRCDLLSDHIERTAGVTAGRNLDKKLLGKNCRLRWASQGQEEMLLEELPQKGKRKLRRWHWGFVGYLASAPKGNLFIVENLLRAAKISRSMNYDRMKKALQKALEEACEVNNLPFRSYGQGNEEQVHFLRVEPEGKKPFTVEGKDFSVHVTWTSFSAYSPESDLQMSDPHYIQYEAKSPAAGRMLYKVLSVNPDALKRIPWDLFGDWLDKHKIHHKTNFSVWH